MCLLRGEGCIEWEGEFLLVECFGDGEWCLLERDLLASFLAGCWCGGCFLLVWRYGVVYVGEDAALFEELFELVAAWGEYGEEVIDVLSLFWSAREAYEGVVDFGVINFGQGPSLLVFLVEMGETGSEYGCLYFVDAAVAALVVEVVVLRGAVVGQCAYGLCECAVVGGDGSGVAECPEGFGGIEAVGSGIAEGACAPAVVLAAVGLCVVFDE